MSITYVINYINPILVPDFDPLNPPRTISNDRFSYDPVHPDAVAIIERLKNCTRESEVRRVVWEEFRDWFLEDIAGDQYSDYYRQAIFDVWRYYCR